MRTDYLRNGAILFVLFIIFSFIWYYFDPTNITGIIAVIFLLAAIYYGLMGLIRSKPSSPVASPVTPSSPVYQPSPTPPPSTSPAYSPEPHAQPAPKTSGPLCPTCGQPLTFVKDINKWYCQNEKKTVTLTAPATNIELQLKAEREELQKELDMAEKRLLEGKISEETYKELKEKYQKRLKQIE